MEYRVDSRVEHPGANTSNGPTKVEPNVRHDLSRAAAVRVLVVEDFESFREFVTLTLAGARDLQVIGEATDGLAAVQKAVRSHLYSISGTEP